MPGSKNQISRYIEIDKCLRSRVKKYWTKQELIEKISEIDIKIRERSLDYDLQNMRESTQLKYHAPIKFSKRENGYYYSDPEYSIRNLPLNEADIKALEFATSILSQYKDISILNDFSGAVDKVVHVVNQIKKKSYEASFRFIDFEKAPYCKGTQHLDTLIDSILEEKVLEIQHKKFSGTETKNHVIHPYLLKEYRNRWYLLGFEEKDEKIKTLGLDRITEIVELKKKFKPAINFSPDLFFKNTIGISFDNKPVMEVVLSFTPSQGEYLKTQYLHETQEFIKDDKTECVIKLKVVINYELIAKILEYGKDVKVIKPTALRKQIAGIVAASHQYYSQ